MRIWLLLWSEAIEVSGNDSRALRVRISTRVLCIAQRQNIKTVISSLVSRRDQLIENLKGYGKYLNIVKKHFTMTFCFVLILFLLVWASRSISAYKNLFFIFLMLESTWIMRVSGNLPNVSLIHPILKSFHLFLLQYVINVDLFRSKHI